MFEKIKNNKANSFEKFKKGDIELAEKRMGIKIPNELKQFYLQIGCGFIESKHMAFNRIMDPMSCADLRLREDFYEFDPELEGYEIFEEGKMVFFERNDGIYAEIELTDNETSKIYSGNDLIANSLEEFLEVCDEYYIWEPGFKLQ